MKRLLLGILTMLLLCLTQCDPKEKPPIADPMELSAEITHVLEYGKSTGAIDLTVTGGFTPYSYEWSNDSTTQDISDLYAGTYKVAVYDDEGSHILGSYIVKQPESAFSASTSITNVLEFGKSTGAIDLTVSGGTPPYTYLWSNGATTQDLAQIPAGTYTVTITDANGIKISVESIVSQPESELKATTVVTNVLEFGKSTGSIDVTVSGGVSPYTYLWNTGATSQDLNNIPAGTYTLVITDANSVKINLSATVSQPESALTAILVVTHVIEYGTSTGSISVTASGGVPPYTYSWNTGSTSQNLTNIPAGTYTVIIKDSNGIEKTGSAIVTQPGSPLTATFVVTHVLQYGASTGSINVTVAGGVSPYTYRWSNGSTTQDLNNIPAGIYTLVITDANGINTTINATVNQPSSALSATTSITHILEYGASTGSVDVTVSGGVSPYTYSWSNGATTQDLNNVVAGAYTLTITDSNGIKITITAIITQPASALTATTVLTHVKCYGASTGSIDLSVSGGATPYTYLWSNGATTQDISALKAGTYTVTIKDANNVSKTHSATITQPTQITTSVSVIDAKCFGSTGSINVTVSGGTSPYTYSWSNGATTQDLTSVTIGTYNLTITDANGCTATLSATVKQPTIINATSTTTIAEYEQNTGSINLTVSGGTSPYTYLWSNGATTQDISNIGAGTYTVTITDANGCTKTHSATVSELPPPPPPPAADWIIDHNDAKLDIIPLEWIAEAKTKLHIAYEHTSHGQQLVEGMTGLVNWKGSTYAFNSGGSNGALDLRDHAIAKIFSCWGMDLGNTRCPDNEQYYLWATNTRTYLNTNPGVNVVIWSWCGQLSYATDANVDQYLSLMNQLEMDYPNIKFIYMTGHVDQWQKSPSGRVYINNQRIRNYCISNNKILFDFADIESYDPDGNYYGDKYVGDDGCYDANGNGKTETNGGDPALPINGDKSWMLDYQNSHTLNVDWFQCASAHSYPINANRKAYAAWYLWARLAGWDGN